MSDDSDKSKKPVEPKIKTKPPKVDSIQKRHDGELSHSEESSKRGPGPNSSAPRPSRDSSTPKKSSDRSKD